MPVTEPERVKNIVENFDPSSPLASAQTPPSSWYTDPDFFELEKNQILLPSWQPVARTENLSGPGSYVAGQYLDEPYLLTRNEENQTQAFYNVCRHHASRLLNGKGKCETITCPYHAWQYDLSGTLKKAPEISGMQGFDRKNYSLKRIRHATWGPYEWLHFSEENHPSPSLSRHLDFLDGWISEKDFSTLRYCKTIPFPINCNWKVFVDNYLDGGYHIQHAHRGLASVLTMEDYQLKLYEQGSIQYCDGPEETRVGGKAVYAFIYPNLMINAYGSAERPIIDINWVVPDGPKKCQVIFDYFFHSSWFDDPSALETALRDSRQIQIEDIEICENVQKGLESRGYNTGRYAPTKEAGAYQFHQKLQRDLVSSLANPNNSL